MADDVGQLDAAERASDQERDVYRDQEGSAGSPNGVGPRGEGNARRLDDGCGKGPPEEVSFVRLLERSPFLFIKVRAPVEIDQEVMRGNKLGGNK